jgi:hypothetical protein
VSPWLLFLVLIPVTPDPGLCPPIFYFWPSFPYLLTQDCVPLPFNFWPSFPYLLTQDCVPLPFISRNSWPRTVSPCLLFLVLIPVSPDPGLCPPTTFLFMAKKLQLRGKSKTVISWWKTIGWRYYALMLALWRNKTNKGKGRECILFITFFSTLYLSEKSYKMLIIFMKKKDKQFMKYADLQLTFCHQWHRLKVHLHVGWWLSNFLKFSDWFYTLL